jgi:hypothetical protein
VIYGEPGVPEATAKIAARQDPATARNLSADRKLTTNSLTNKTLATNRSASTMARTANTAKTLEEDGVVSTPRTPVESLAAALKDLGYDPSKFKMDMREEFVQYPGGGYTHRYTRVELPNGLSENFSTDLMAQYPSVTANELKRLIDGRYETASSQNLKPPPFDGGT